MDTLNYDVTNIIFKQISAFDRLRLHTVFNEHRPTQFQVSTELIASKGFRGNNGLIMRAITAPHEFYAEDDWWYYYGNGYAYSPGLDYFYPYQHVIALNEEQVKVGNYEPCVHAMVLIQKQLNIDPWTTRESDVRKDVKNFRRQLRLLERALDRSSDPEINNRLDLGRIVQHMRNNMLDDFRLSKINKKNNNKQ